MRKLNSISCIFKRLLHKKRKYPIDPDHVTQIPIFQYAGSNHTRNRVYVWGNIKTGALGVPFNKSKDSDYTVQYLRSPKRLHFAEVNEVITVGCGFGFTLMVVKTETGHCLYGTGVNKDSQIGYHEVRKNKPLEIVFLPQPVFLPFKDVNTTIHKVCGGRAHAAVLSDEGLFLLGNNTYGQCGRPIVENEDYIKSNFINHVADIEGDKIVDVECGQDHTHVITENGRLYSCGWGADGQTGLGHFNNQHNLTQVKGDIVGEKIIKVSCKSDFVLALNDKHQAFGWGNSEYSQLNLPKDTQQVCNPTHVKSLEKFGKIIDVASGGSFCLALNDEGRVFVWGFGLLGTGPEVQQSKFPIEIPLQLFGFNDFNPQCLVKSIACGLSHMTAVTNTGDLYTWGRNRNCCLGLGHDKNQHFPFKVAIGAYVEQTFCGFDHTIAICKSYLTI